MVRLEPRHIDFVSSEGGPLLIGDRDGIIGWRGADGDDYDRLAAAFEAQGEPPAVRIDDGTVRALAWIVWAGSYEVCRLAPDVILLVDAREEEAGSRRVSLGGRSVRALDDFTSRSGWLVILWAPESAIELASVEPEDGRAPDLSIGGAALIVALPPGDYEVLGTADPDLDHLACLIRPVGAETPAQIILPPLPHRDPLSLRPNPLHPPPEPDPEETASFPPAPGQLDMWD